MRVSIYLPVLASAIVTADLQQARAKKQGLIRGNSDGGGIRSTLAAAAEEDRIRDGSKETGAEVEEAALLQKPRRLVEANGEPALATARRFGNIVRSGQNRASKASSEPLGEKGKIPNIITKSMEKERGDAGRSLPSGAAVAELSADSSGGLPWVLLLVCLAAIPVLAGCLVATAADDQAADEKDVVRRRHVPGGAARHRQFGGVQRHVPPARTQPGMPPAVVQNGMSSMPTAGSSALGTAENLGNASPVAPEGAVAAAFSGGSAIASPMASAAGSAMDMSLPNMAPALSPPPMQGAEFPLHPSLVTTDLHGMLIGVPINLKATPEKMVCDINDLERDRTVMRAFLSEPVMQGIMLSEMQSNVPVAFLDTSKAVLDPSGQQDHRHAVLRRASQVNGGWHDGTMPYAVFFLQNRGPGGCTLVARPGDGLQRGANLLVARVGDDGIVTSMQDALGRTSAVAEHPGNAGSPLSSAGTLTRSGPAIRGFRVFHGQDAGFVLCAIIAAQKLWHVT